MFQFPAFASYPYVFRIKIPCNDTIETQATAPRLAIEAGQLLIF